MELKYQFVFYIGLVVVTAFIVWLVIKSKKKAYSTGKKVAHIERLKKNTYFKRKQLCYRIYSIAWFVFALIGTLAAFLLVARPYKTETVDEEKYQRDIILCMDISTSVDEVNKNLIKELKKTVHQLQGERFGIVIFNTSPVLLVPLTDDYEFVEEQLDMVQEGLERRLSGFYTNMGDYYYYEEYISSGTLVGNEERGSSLIADGLASCVYDFSEEDKERTRVIIFSTDNDPQGESFLSLEEAAGLCKENNITVYGIGTKNMYDNREAEMKSAVENTGGKFYLEEDSGSFNDIVTEIQKKSQNLVKGHHQVMEIECPETMFKILLLCMVSLVILTKLLRR